MTDPQIQLERAKRIEHIEGSKLRMIREDRDRIVRAYDAQERKHMQAVGAVRDAEKRLGV